MNLILLIPVLFPVLAGAVMPLLKLDKDRTMRQIYVTAIVVVNFILVLFTAFMGNAEFRGFHVPLLHFAPAYHIIGYSVPEGNGQFHLFIK